MQTLSKEEEIERVHGKGTHITILGAGASFASTLMTPERNGKQLPLMKNIVDIVELNNLVNQLPKNLQSLQNDFEKLYSKISSEKNLIQIKEEIEKKVYSYFSELDLPDEPTIYDYLILSLRHHKDIIATFNWDPFLYKAYVRNGEFVRSPGILFLHGCVSIGYDRIDHSSGPAGWYSKKTKRLFEPTKLLYPVNKKDYNTDEYIKGQWDTLARKLKSAERVTIFGYSAPETDVEAIQLLNEAWGDVETRSMEEFEFIDIMEEAKLINSWVKFVHTHHYHYCNDYFDSSLARHPRRSVESYHHWSRPMTIKEAFQDGNLIPNNL